jgi:hypothetical protein
MLKKFIHIGYPKNFSTSLQYDFFAKHEEIFHLGIGPELAYADPLVDSAFEVYLKTAKEFKYAEAEAKLEKHFSELFVKAEAAGKKVITASSEHLSFAFANDSIGFKEKMARLSGLFGNDAHIILIIRNQFDLIKSLYRESVRVGFPGDFSSYVYLFYKYQDRNYCYDLRYDLVLDTLVTFFKKENIHLFIFENMRSKDGELIRRDGKIRLLDDLGEAMGIAYHEIDFGHYNEALTDNVVREKAELNKANRHDLGNILYDTAEKHRMKYYLTTEIGLNEKQEELYGDVLMKRKLIALAKEKAGDKPQVKLDYSVDENILRQLKSFYEQGNKLLESGHGYSLPGIYYDLKF